MNIGARLRTGREARGLSLPAVASAIRIHPRFLTAIEENDWRALPPRPYGRGFVRAYASLLGEHPEQTVRDYFAQFAPPPAPGPVQTAEPPAPARARRSVRVRSGPTAAVLTGLVVVALVTVAALRREPARAPSSNGVVATAGLSSPSPAGTTGTAEPRPEPDAPVRVDIEATAAAWVTATVDGRRAIYRTMRAGERETLRGRDTIWLRVGDAGAIRWRVNGRPAEAMGTSGAVRSARVTAQ